MEIVKLNESFSKIIGSQEEIKKIFEFLKVERPGAYFDELVKRGFKSPFDYFAKVLNQNELLVLNGHLQLLDFKPPIGEEPDDVEDFLENINNILPFKPYDYQIEAFRDSLKTKKQICRMSTSSGKSLTISMIAQYFFKRGKKGLLLVPNINLLTQFKNDIASYNLNELYENTHIIGGGQSDKSFKLPFTISTWQSLQDLKLNSLDDIDYIMVDEAHRFASDVTSSIVKASENCKYKLGFTGTLPEDPVMKMTLLGLFGLPKTFITARQLIDRGLGTPIKINSIIFDYNREDKNAFNGIKAIGNAKYAKQLGFLKEHDLRSEFISNLSIKLKNNSLILFSHTEHGKLLYTKTMNKLFPNVTVENKNITGKKSFLFQEQYGVYFLNGEDDAKTRELTRKILEDDHFIITLEDDTTITLHGNDLVKLENGEEKLVKDLTPNDVLLDH